MKSASRRRLAKLHKWTGLVIGLFLAVQCLTGLLLVWEAEIVALAAPSANPAASDPGSDDLPELFTSVAQKFDGHVVTRIDYPPAPGHPFVLYLHASDGADGQQIVLAVRGEDGYILGESTVATALAFAFDWHHEVAAGSAGRALVGLLGMALVFMAVTGAVVWWPGRTRLRGSLSVSPRKPPATFYWQLHRTIGVLALPLMLLTAVSGTLLAFRPWLEPEIVAPPVEALLPCRPGEHVDRLAAAMAALPGMRIRDLRFAVDGSRLERVLFVNRSKVGIGAPHQVQLGRCGAEVTKVRRADLPGRQYEAFLGWLYPVHTGLAMGPVGRLAAALAGCLIAGLLVTGGLLWLRRRPRSGPV